MPRYFFYSRTIQTKISSFISKSFILVGVTEITNLACCTVLHKYRNINSIQTLNKCQCRYKCNDKQFIIPIIKRYLNYNQNI